MLKKLRIAVLLYVLAFVAVGHYLTQRQTRSWDMPLWVDVYPVAGEPRPSVERYVAGLDADTFATAEAFFAAHAQRLGLETQRPFRFDIAPRLETPPPAMPAEHGFADTLLWSLRLRWFTTRLVWSSDRPRPDIVLYAVYHGSDDGRVLDDSSALRKGRIVVAHLFAARAARATNEVVVAHELLHTVGATDKYDPATAMPIYPEGFAAPEARPRYPQTHAELMGGRIPVARGTARMPRSLDDVVIGPVTATEIGWARQAD